MAAMIAHLLSALQSDCAGLEKRVVGIGMCHPSIQVTKKEAVNGQGQTLEGHTVLDNVLLARRPLAALRLVPPTRSAAGF